MNTDWATRGAPDAKSTIEACRVLVAMGGRGTPPVLYLIQKDGLSRAQAEAVVAACQPDTVWQKIVRFVWHR